MALIQISDPESKVETKKSFSVGIDLGTTNSLIAERNDQKVHIFSENASCSKQVMLPKHTFGIVHLCPSPTLAMAVAVAVSVFAAVALAMAVVVAVATS